jgi:hypothetical protein
MTRKSGVKWHKMKYLGFCEKETTNTGVLWNLPY